MRVLHVADYVGGGTTNVALPIVKALQQQGWETRFQGAEEPIEGKWDVVHFWNIRAADKHSDKLDCPSIQTINSFPQFCEGHYLAAAHAANWVHTHDLFIVRYLGLFYDIFNVTRIEQTFDHTAFKPLPLPTTFTLGWLGCDYSFKRFEIARAVAKGAGIPYLEWDISTQNRSNEELLRDFYGQISCYLVTSYNDSGPLPPQEALLCGRPVVSTLVGMMPEVIRSGINGELFDGTVQGGIEAVRTVQSSFYWPEKTALPHVLDVLPRYMAMYEKVAAL